MGAADAERTDAAAAAAAAGDGGGDATVARLRTLRPVPPLQVVSQDAAATPVVASASVADSASTSGGFHSTPTPQSEAATLNSRAYTNPTFLCIFLLHAAAAAFAVGFFVYRALRTIITGGGTGPAGRELRLLTYWLPPIEGAVALSIILAFGWQQAMRAFPQFMVPAVLWSGFGTTMAAGILLLCISLPSTTGLGIALILFSIGTGLYNCWVIRRVPFTARVMERALVPASKFRGLNAPAYLMVAVGFLWISVWCVGVIGAMEFDYPALTTIGLVLSLAWTVEVMRNVTNLTVSRVVALYYLRGMQSSVQFSFQRAVSHNLGSACLGSLFVPTIEAARIVARGLNLLEGEDEFMFSCAHCCLHVMECVFRYGNSWAFVHIAAYGKGFVPASMSTWALFEGQNMAAMVDSDITSGVCFLTGVSSGALCTILAATWALVSQYKYYAATVSLMAFFVGYLITRIGMALPQACVACYYVCFAENPSSRLFDSTIRDRLELIADGRDPLVPTPRFPRRSLPTPTPRPAVP